jgi:predicted acyltransferase
MPTANRLSSLDALRGFDMFWIIGAEDIFHTLAKATGSPFWQSLSDQFHHPYWNGFTAYDLIFPLFIFISGISATYSLGTAIDKGTPRPALVRKVLRRGIILFILGMVYNNGLQIRPLADFRIMSVLGRIGIAYSFSCLIFLYSGPRARYLWFASLLLGYWAILACSSAPGFPPGDLTEAGNFASWFDRTVLPGKLSRGIHDTVGLFNNIPAVASGLAGILTGDYLRSSTHTPARTSTTLAVAGILALLIAQVWDTVFPINKNLWSSSFVMNTAGWSLLLMALFHFIIDVRGHRKWTFFFQVIGINSILIYLSPRFIDWSHTNQALFHWLGDIIGNPYQAVALAATAVLVKWTGLWFLYRKNVFLKV